MEDKVRRESTTSSPLRKVPWSAITLMVTVGIISMLVAYSVMASDRTPEDGVTPTPGPVPTVQVSPSGGSPGTLITVRGEGWQAGDTVFVRLDLLSGDQEQQPIASAPVMEDGRFAVSFTIPADERWTSLTRALVVVQSAATGGEVVAVLRVSGPDQTPTPPPTATPTLTPTQPAPTPTPTPVVPPTPTPTISGWRGEYYGNRDLTGVPQLVRNDAAVNFDWGSWAPASGLPADRFSVRWTRTLWFRGGTYRLYARSDDGVRVWLDGQLIIDQWHDATGASYSAQRTLSAGMHTMRVEYYENRGAARIAFWWERTSDFPQWRGEYFSNVDLIGASVLVRNDVAVDFNWGYGAPATGLPADGFSTRWTRLQAFEEGLHRFHVTVDDGVRLYVDDRLLIDAWYEGAARELTADLRLSAGYHSLRVEYYEQAGRAQIRLWWEKLASYPDWRGEYWSNRRLDGAPALVRNDARIDFDWGRNAPAANLPADRFSARWTRNARFEGATYRFHVLVDDGARLWVDDRLVIDAWSDGGAREVTADHALVQGTHSLRVEYYERTGRAQIRVWWEKVTSPSFPDWRGQYWSNRALSGSPSLVRNDAAVDFYWGTGAPAAGLGSDNFSARWTRERTFEAGVYRFYAWADDGIRVYVDGDLILDKWVNSSGDEVYMVDLALRGQHELVVEYYEQAGEAFTKFWWKRVGDWPTPPNQSPVAVEDSAITDEDTPVDISVLTNDSDPDGDTLTVSDFDTSSVEGGTVNCGDAGLCTYAPSADFNGTDTFAYTISDGKGGTDTAAVSVDVQSVNDPPVAVDDAANTDAHTPVDVNVLANDSDVDGDTLSVSEHDTASAQGGTVTCTSDGACTYTPPADFSGADTFAYTVSDGKGGTDTGTVAVEVRANPVNQPPVAENDFASTNALTPVDIDVLANDSDPDGDSLTISASDGSSAEGGTVTCTSDGVCTYTPPADFGGVDTFAYVVSDGRGKTDLGIVTVSVAANPANRPPVAADDFASTDGIAAVAVDVLANDSDPDGDTLTMRDYDAFSVQGGAVTCTSAGVCTYTAPAGIVADAFTYTIGDGNSATDVATVTLAVVRINELLPAPAETDWDGDGTADARDEYVELHNTGTAAIDIGGWALADGVGDATPYVIPEGTVIQPGGFATFYGGETALALPDDGGTVRLLGPSGALVDVITFGLVGSDASYSRDESGSWHSDWAPSPGEANQPPSQ